jgi:hypothetical protein
VLPWGSGWSGALMHRSSFFRHTPRLSGRGVVLFQGLNAVYADRDPGGLL